MYGNCVVGLNYSGSKGRGLDPVKHVYVVDLLFNVHGKHLRSCRDGQLT